MLRRVIGGLLTLMLVATLLLPVASVGAQEDEVDANPAPVTTEETIPDSAPPAVVEEPPVHEPQPEAPVVEQPVVEEPVAEAPVMDAPAIEESVTEDPAVAEPVTEEPAAAEPSVSAEDGADDEELTPEPAVDESDAVEAAETTSISGLGLTCAGLLTFTIDATNGGALTIWLYTIDDVENSDLGEEIVANPSTGATQVQFSLESASLTDTIGASLVDDNYDVIGQTTASGCAGDEDDGEEEDEPTAATVISGASLDCDGTLTFTIAEAAGETLSIAFTNLHAPSLNQDMGSVSFPVTGTGTFQVSIDVSEWVDVFQADINSPLAGVIGQAAAYGCISGEEQTLGGISGMTLSCAGVTTFNIDLIGGSVRISLYDGSANPHLQIASESLGYIIDGEGESRTIDFALPADTYDNLVVRAYAHNNWAALDIAYATDCLGEEEPSGDVVIDNLTVTCDGLTSFDVTTPEPVALDVLFTIGAAAPGYRVSTQITASTGPQQVQLTPRSNGAPQWYAFVSLGDEVLASATVLNCPWRPPNTMPGVDVAVEVGGGTITFDEVLEVGDTTVTELDPSEAPPLPAEFDGYQVILLDITTTAQFAGPVQICLPVAADAENVRLLHFENGGWVDITTVASAAEGVVCGVTSNFSPFAIVRLADDTPLPPVHPGQPGGPGKPEHPGKPVASSTGQSGSGTTLTTLPVTGGGAQPAETGTPAVLLLLCALVAVAALGVRRPTRLERASRP